jgi:hypothetical protein
MATKRIVPRATGEGGVGRSDKLMGPSYFSECGLSSKIRITEAVVTTTNATPTVLWSKVLADNEVIHVQAQVVAGNAGATYAAAYARNCLARKPGSGSAVVVKSNTMALDSETTTSLNMTWAISGGNTLQLLATGYSGQTMTWRAEIKTIIAN